MAKIIPFPVLKMKQIEAYARSVEKLDVAIIGNHFLNQVCHFAFSIGVQIDFEVNPDKPERVRIFTTNLWDYMDRFDVGERTSENLKVLHLKVLTGRIRLLTAFPKFFPNKVNYALQFASTYHHAKYRPLVIKEFERFLPDILACKKGEESFFQLSLDRYYDPLERRAFSGNSNWRTQDKISQFLDRLLSLYIAECRWEDAENILTKMNERLFLHQTCNTYHFFSRTNRCYEGYRFLKVHIPKYRAKRLDVEWLLKQQEWLKNIQPTPWAEPKYRYKPRKGARAKPAKGGVMRYTPTKKPRYASLKLLLDLKE